MAVTLRVWDALFLEGAQVLHRTALALLRRLELSVSLPPRLPPALLMLLCFSCSPP